MKRQSLECLSQKKRTPRRHPHSNAVSAFTPFFSLLLFFSFHFSFFPFFLISLFALFTFHRWSLSLFLFHFFFVSLFSTATALPIFPFRIILISRSLRLSYVLLWNRNLPSTKFYKQFVTRCHSNVCQSICPSASLLQLYDSDFLHRCSCPYVLLAFHNHAPTHPQVTMPIVQRTRPRWFNAMWRYFLFFSLVLFVLNCVFIRMRFKFVVAMCASRHVRPCWLDGKCIKNGCKHAICFFIRPFALYEIT